MMILDFLRANLHDILLVTIMALVTILLRFLPFWVFAGEKKTPEIILYLGRVLPFAIMGMLVVFCLKGTTLGALSGWLPQLIAGGAVVLVHIWKRNTLLSILVGTVLYMVLVQLVF